MAIATRLQAELDKAGIPTYGCNSSGVIQFKDEATKEQRDQAAVIMANFDFQAPEKTQEDVKTEVEALSPEAREKLLTLALSEYLSRHPDSL